jgi:hypothetical protein
MSEQTAQPWYREFWAWFILAPLILIVLVCSVLISVAVSGRDDLVVDDYYKVGKLINQEFVPEQEANRLNMRAKLNFDLESGELHIQLNQAQTEDLVLELSHPSDSRLDTSIQLLRISPDQYRADIDPLQLSRWYLRLNSLTPDEEVVWRLKGELNLALSTSTELQFLR